MKLVILDRESVIDRNGDGYVLEPRQWEPLSGTLDAIARLHHGGYRVAVVTNQAALSRGLLDMTMLNLIHQRMCRMAEAAGGEIDAIAICPHSPELNCDCRMPKPGMLLELIERFGTAASQTAMVGGSQAEVQAGLNAGCRTWLVRPGPGAAMPVSGEGIEAIALYDDRAPVVVCDDLEQIVDQLLSAAPPERQPSR